MKTSAPLQNPVYPLVSEIEELYKAAFYGKEAKKGINIACEKRGPR